MSREIARHALPRQNRLFRLIVEVDLLRFDEVDDRKCQTEEAAAGAEDGLSHSYTAALHLL